MQFSRKILLQDQIPYVEVLDTEAGDIKTVMEPAGVYLLESVAGGGSGGGATSNAAGGGGNGRYKSAIVRSSAPFIITYQVGAGGDISTGNGGSGGVGGNGCENGGKGGSGGHISWTYAQPHQSTWSASAMAGVDYAAFRDTKSNQIIYLAHETWYSSDAIGTNGASITLISKIPESASDAYETYVCEVVEKWKTVKYGDKIYERYPSADHWAAVGGVYYVRTGSPGGGGGGGAGGNGGFNRSVGGAGGGAGGGYYSPDSAANIEYGFYFSETSTPGQNGPAGAGNAGYGRPGVNGNQDFTVYSGAGGSGYKHQGGAKATGGGASGGSGGGGKYNDDSYYKRRGGGGGGGAPGDSTAGGGQGGLSIDDWRTENGAPYRTTGAQGISPTGERVDAAYGAGGGGGGNPGFSGWVSIKRIA